MENLYNGVPINSNLIEEIPNGDYEVALETNNNTMEKEFYIKSVILEKNIKIEG